MRVFTVVVLLLGALLFYAAGVKRAGAARDREPSPYGPAPTRLDLRDYAADIAKHPLVPARSPSAQPPATRFAAAPR